MGPAYHRGGPMFLKVPENPIGGPSTSTFAPQNPWKMQGFLSPEKYGSHNHYQIGLNFRAQKTIL